MPHTSAVKPPSGFNPPPDKRRVEKHNSGLSFAEVKKQLNSVTRRIMPERTHENSPSKSTTLQPSLVAAMGMKKDTSWRTQVSLNSLSQKLNQNQFTAMGSQDGSTCGSRDSRSLKSQEPPQSPMEMRLKAMDPARMRETFALFVPELGPEEDATSNREDDDASDDASLEDQMTPNVSRYFSKPQMHPTSPSKDSQHTSPTASPSDVDWSESESCSEWGWDELVIEEVFAPPVFEPAQMAATAASKHRLAPPSGEFTADNARSAASKYRLAPPSEDFTVDDDSDDLDDDNLTRKVGVAVSKNFIAKRGPSFGTLWVKCPESKAKKHLELNLSPTDPESIILLDPKKGQSWAALTCRATQGNETLHAIATSLVLPGEQNRPRSRTPQRTMRGRSRSRTPQRMRRMDTERAAREGNIASPSLRASTPQRSNNRALTPQRSSNRSSTPQRSRNRALTPQRHSKNGTRGRSRGKRRESFSH